MRRFFLPLVFAAAVVSSTARAAECVPNDVAVHAIIDGSIAQFGHAPEIVLHYDDPRAGVLIGIAVEQISDAATKASIAAATSVDIYVVKNTAAFINFRRGDCTQGGASMDLDTFLKLMMLVEKHIT